MMTTLAKLAPSDDTTTIRQLSDNPHSIYRRLRAEAPVLRVRSVGKTMRTKAEDTTYVQDNPEFFPSNDPQTPMEQSFLSHTLMRKDDAANAEMDALFERVIPRQLADPNPTVLLAMVNAEHPIAKSQTLANMKIAVGGGVNEPRDALLTILYGLLTNPDQLAECRENTLWTVVFEERGRWVAPSHVSTRLVTAMTPAMLSAQDVTLRLHQFLPPLAVSKLILKPWTAGVEEAWGECIKIEHYDAMALGGTPPA